MKGCYVLLINLKSTQNIAFGTKHNYDFKKGYYAYVGSALHGLEHRIQRHLRHNKKLFWHIDYLLKYATITQVYYKENAYREECSIANQLQQNFESIKGFGCSDCRCSSHLFYAPYSQIIKRIQHLDMKQLPTKPKQ
jgi:Uri superfamily endonuclease